MAASANKKRVNFSPIEKETLAEVIAKYKHIIEDKSTKALMVDKKAKAWEDVAKDYNAAAETGFRTAKQLKVLYDNQKRDLKKVIAEKHHADYKAKIEAKEALQNDKIEIFKTDGGSANLMLTPQQELILAGIGEQINPLPNPVDSAAVYFDDVDITVFDLPHPDEPEPAPAPKPIKKSRPVLQF